MNRPNKDYYTKYWVKENDQYVLRGLGRYQEDLEKYCSELEKRLKMVEKALDKTCNELVNLKEAADCWAYPECPFREECEKTLWGDCYKANSWKEWSMKNE